MSIKSLILLLFQGLTMVYLVSTFSISKSALVILFQGIGILILIWAILVGGINGFNAQPEVRSQILFTKGPFAVLRNPMYFAILLFFTTDLIANGTLLRWLALVLLAITLLLKIYREEHFLKEKFNQAYLDYKSKTYRLIPWIY